MRNYTVAKLEKKPMHPIWRGVGCFGAIFVFVTAFFLSSWFVDYMTSCRPPPIMPISSWFVQTLGQVPGCDTPPNLPNQLKFLPSSLRDMTVQFRDKYPWFNGIGKYVPPILVSIVIAMFLFGIIGVIYAFLRGEPGDAKDVRNWQPEGRKKRKVRRCR